MGNNQEKVYPVRFFSKTGTPIKPSKKHTPRAITLLIGQKLWYPFLLALFWGTTTHRYTCRRLIRYFDVSRFSLDGSSRLWVGSGCQAPEEFCGGKRLCFHLVSTCACFMPHTINREIVQQSCYVIGFYVWICGRTCRGVHIGSIVKWYYQQWKSEGAKINKKQ